MFGKQCTQTQMRYHGVSFPVKRLGNQPNNNLLQTVDRGLCCKKISNLRVTNQMKVGDSANTQNITNKKSVVHFGVDSGALSNHLQDKIDNLEEDLLSWDLDIAPGAGGKKQFPSDDEDDEFKEDEFQTQNDGNTLNSTKKCYEEFPFLIKASCPLNVPNDGIPVGDTLSTCPDAGPGTGKRRFPSEDDIDASSTSHTRANHLNTKEDNLREVAMRRSC